MKDYIFYTANDFALDEDFQNWVLHPDVKNKYFWKKWIQEHNDKSHIIIEGVSLVRSVNYRSYSLLHKEKKQLLGAISNKIDVEEDEILSKLKSGKAQGFWKGKWKYAIVAVFAGLVIISSLWLMAYDSSSTGVSFSSNTGYGEVKKLILPDGSEVILNANSRLVYSEKNNREREVWMEGEAHFNVKHTLDNRKFIVHTFDKLSVEVLGTSFNVNSRGDQIAVVLQDGSIKLEIEETSKNTKTQLYLKPGEMVSYNKKKGEYMKKVVDSEVDSWATGRLQMNDYSLGDAALFIQETFGKNVVVNDSGLMTYKISGSMPIVYNIDTMIIQFERAFNVHFYKRNDDILIRK